MELEELEVLELKAHSELCLNQEYCMHGGTCYWMPSLGRQYCQCTDNFEGERCHLKKVVFYDYDSVKPFRASYFNSMTMKPIALVVGLTLVVMVLLFLVYLLAKCCYKKCTKMDKGAKKSLIYQDASAQTSTSKLHLLNHTECNGLTTCGQDSNARTRLDACSATPDTIDDCSKIHSTNPNSDPELGIRNSFIKSGHRSSNPTNLTSENETERARTGSEQQKHQKKTPPCKMTLLGNQYETDSQCVSPNDSNNNTDNFLFSCSNYNETNNSEAQTDKEKSDEGQAITDINDTESCELYDSDPEATAL